MIAPAQPAHTDNLFQWKQLARLPEAEGLAGAYAGVSNGALIVAGGTNFPGNKRPWTNGTKTWYDKVYVLEQEGGNWKKAGTLPRPLGYGVALTCKDGLLCVGGGDAKENYATAFILKWTGGKLQTEPLPDMPAPLINACGAVMQNKVYIAGGIQTPTGLTGNNFWCLDLSLPAARRKWEVLPPLPGPSRMLAMAGAADGHVSVFGGVHLVVSPPDTAAHREYLQDSWQYTPGKGWKQLASMPYPLAAAPSPAYAPAGGQELFLLGGDDGSYAARTAELKDAHPGFRNDILCYHTRNDQWTVAGTIPVDKKPDTVTNPHGSVYAPVTTPLVVWRGKIILAGGEARPAVRSSRVLVAEPSREKTR